MRALRSAGGAGAAGAASDQSEWAVRPRPFLVEFVSIGRYRMLLAIDQSPQVPQQVGDLVVDLRRVPDDQADAQEERRDRCRRSRG